KAVLGPIVTGRDGVKELSPGEPADLKVWFNSDERWPLVEKMFDPNVKLMYGTAKTGGRVYFDDNKKGARDQIADNPTPVPGTQDGQVASYPADVAKSIELSKGTANTTKDVAELYGLPPLREDPLQGRPPAAFQWLLKGDVDGAMRESVNRVIRDVRKKKG